MSVRACVCAAAVIAVSLAPAHAAQVCAWMIETNAPDEVRNVDVWLEADKEIDFLYQVGGAGIVSEIGRINSPGSGTYTLDPHVPAKPWGFGATLNTPGKIDISFELHKTPADIFSDAPTALLARFAFQRNIPAGETSPPKTLAKKQCATIAE